MKDNKKFISEYPIEKFIGNVALLDVRGEKIIELKDEYYKNIRKMIQLYYLLDGIIFMEKKNIIPNIQQLVWNQQNF